MSSVLQCVVDCLQLYRTRVGIPFVPLWPSRSVCNEHVGFLVVELGQGLDPLHLQNPIFLYSSLLIKLLVSEIMSLKLLLRNVNRSKAFFGQTLLVW